MRNLIWATVVATCFLSYGCQFGSWSEIQKIAAAKDSIRMVYAPDKRVALFDIDVSFINTTAVLEGVSDQPKALTVLVDYIATRGFETINKVSVLPDDAVGDLKFGIINNSVGNIRSEPRHSGELATQAVLGTEVQVLQISGEWYLIKTPDDYISWIDHGGVELATEVEMQSWRDAKKVIVTAISGYVYDEQNPEKVISDVVLGSQLKLVGNISWTHHIVEFPDGRRGIINKKIAQPYEAWKGELKASSELVELYARQLLGFPYLWGGTSTKGMDCSGFTKTVYLMNGLVIPRDASQQVNAGLEIEKGKNFENLQKGDLLFFGKPATDDANQKVTHVGIWLGNMEFIHASKRVRIDSFDPNAENYDEFNLNRYLESRRYLDNKIGNIEALR